VTADELLRQNPDPSYYGRLPDSVGETDLSPDQIGMRRLACVPRMIRAHFHARDIDFSWVSTCFGQSSNYYVVQTKDGTRFLIE